MSSGKMIFNVEEVGRLRTKMGQVSQDTNRLYMQVRGQSSNWSGIPLGANLQQAQVLINELTVEAEKLEELIQTAVKGVQNVQEENKRQSNQLFQQFGALGRLFERLGGSSITVQTAIPPVVRTAVTKLITTVATLSGRDELSRDPVVQKLEGIQRTSTFGSVDWFAAGTKLKGIYDARNQIAKAQTAYAVYQAFGNKIQMDAAHQLAEDARQRLGALGVNKLQYESGKDLSGYFKQTAIKACDYDPSITDKSVPLPEKENYAFLLRMAMEPGAKGEWAKQQLALIKPEATIGPVDPYNSVSEADILNRNDPAVIERLKGTYWFTLPVEEQDRRYEALKAEYDKLEKSYAEKNRLHASGVGNQTLANILMGGSNIIGNAINTGSFGIAGTITEWIMGPEPEGYVNPLDNAYGKKAGQTLGTFVSIGLPWKFLNGVKTPGMVGKFSPTLYKSMIAGAVSGAIEETLDAFNDYRDDGKQSLSGRAFSVGINTVIAGAGDALFTVGSKALAGVKKFMKGPIREVELKGVEGSTSTKVENTGKPKEVEEVRVEGTGKPDRQIIINDLYDRTKNIRDQIKKKADEIRKSEAFINLSSKQRKLLEQKLRRLETGNLASAKVEIFGVNKEYISHSQINTLDDLFSDLDNFTHLRNDKIFETYVEDVFPRYQDTEAKILEDIASQIKDSNAKGVIDLYSHFEVCQSCTNLIFEFRRKFPNITLNVYTNSMR